MIKDDDGAKKRQTSEVISMVKKEMFSKNKNKKQSHKTYFLSQN